MTSDVPTNRGGDEDEEDWILQDRLREVGILLEHGQEEEGDRDYGDDPLMGLFQHAEGGDVEQLTQLLKDSSIDLNTPGPDGDTALHLACLYGHQGCAEALLDHGASADAINEEDGSSTLHDAAAGGYLDICKLLLDRASTDLVHKADADGDTPLHHAARGNHAAVVELLLAHGADPSKLNTEGRTPAGEAEERDVVALLVKAAAEKAVS